MTFKEIQKFEIQKFDKYPGTVLKKFHYSMGLLSKIQIYIAISYFHIKFEGLVPFRFRFKKVGKVRISEVR